MTPTTLTETRYGPSPIKADSGHSVGQVRAMLREWARWVTWPEPLGPKDAGCGSAESAYRSPQCWDDRLPRPIEPDWRIGLRIEAVVRDMPKVDARVLRAWYVFIGPRITHVHHDPFEIAARRAHVGSAAYFAQVLARAEDHIRNTLDKSLDKQL